jgi:CelD/BcsL family acetyltransferase involved in cellulose biosynthesis
MPLHVELLSHVDQLTIDFCSQWQRLPQRSPMQSPTWLLAWWQAFAGESWQLQIVSVYDDQRLVGLAPWYLVGKQLRFLGDGTVCSDHADLAIANGYNDSVVTEIANWLTSHASKHWDFIQFDAVDAGEGPIVKVLKQLRSNGLATHERAMTGCWHVDLPGTWEEYLAALSKNHRKRCRRWLRSYFDCGRAEVSISSRESVESAWGEISALNRQRREQVGDRSAFLNQRFHAFHLGVLPQLIEQGRAELRQLRVDGEPVAAEYLLLDGRTIYCYQSGLRTVDSVDGYGNLSILALFRDAIERGYSRVDFLRGDEEYKSHWGAERTGCLQMSVSGNSLNGSLNLAMLKSCDWLRGWKASLVGSN